LHGEETTTAETKVQHFPCELTMSLNGDLKVDTTNRRSKSPEREAARPRVSVDAAAGPTTPKEAPAVAARTLGSRIRDPKPAAGKLA
jgi:hypothetical protein